ncbi:MAG: M20/M25/M40 family metallo-hydrolase [Thermoplasmatota archaeon]
MNANEAWRLLEDAVSVPSPTGSEGAVVRLLQEAARRFGFRVVEDRAGNFVAEAGRGKRLLLFVGHVDTVPGWIPVREEGGVLWGRGCVDAKGALLAILAAAHAHLDDPKFRIMVVGAVDEEGHSEGAKAIDRALAPSWIIVGEPSGASGVTLGYKGILRARFNVRSPAIHGGHPAPNALDRFHSFWTDVRHNEAFGEGFEAMAGRLDAVESQSDGLEDRVAVRIQVRLPPQVVPGEVVRRLCAVAARHGGTLEIDEAMPAAVTDGRSPLVAAFRGAIRAEGEVPHLKHKTGTADFNHLAAWFPGVPMVAYGPGDSQLDHTPNERLERSEFERAVSVLGRVLATLASLP